MLFVNVPQYKFIILCNIAVAPFVGAWIEMNCYANGRAVDESLPLWERGLKYIGLIKENAQGSRSLPLWERGLKCQLRFNIVHTTPSLPLWERGLKLVRYHPQMRILRRSLCGSVD